MEARSRKLGHFLLATLPLSMLTVALGLGVGVALAQFDGSPTAPEPFEAHPEFASWDVQVHSRNQDSWADNKLSSMTADHGADCSGPPDTHETHSYTGAVFVCKDHLMTAISETGYGLIVLTPNQLADFSKGTAKIDFDMSTFRTSDRDWVDFWLTPWQDNLTLPFDTGVVDLQGPPKNAVKIQMAQFKGKTDFIGSVIRGGEEQQLPRAYKFMQDSFAPDKARRDQFELLISKTHIKFWMPQYNLVWIDKDIPPLPFDTAVFQLAHHSYNPAKGQCIDNCPAHASGDTWHWDNVAIAPSDPFIVIHGTPRSVSSSKPGDAGEVNFSAPAPANAFLRFSAFADVSLSFDGGATYQPVQPQKQFQAVTASYFVPIPEGTKQVKLRFGPNVMWYKGPFEASDFAVWSQTDAPAARSNVTPQTPAAPDRSRLTPPDTGDAGLVSTSIDINAPTDMAKRASIQWRRRLRSRQR